MIWIVLLLVCSLAGWWRCIILELRNRRQEEMLQEATKQGQALAKQNASLYVANADLVLRLQWHEDKDSKVRIRSAVYNPKG